MDSKSVAPAVAPAVAPTESELPSVIVIKLEEDECYESLDGAAFQSHTMFRD